jgi:hypothetical protein
LLFGGSELLKLEYKSFLLCPSIFSIGIKEKSSYLKVLFGLIYISTSGDENYNY